MPAAGLSVGLLKSDPSMLAPDESLYKKVELSEQVQLNCFTGPVKTPFAKIQLDPGQKVM